MAVGFGKKGQKEARLRVQLLCDSTLLQQSIYEIVRLIPSGRATSYGAIAKAVGYPNFSRLVGKIMSQCPSDDNIPAHRVVNSQGYLSAKDAFGAPGQMQKRLESEGVVVANDRIRDWKQVFWNPMTEILLMALPCRKMDF